MTDFNTGNPIGSTDPRDLSDNAEAFDRAINDTSSPTWLDRFGNARPTLSGQIGFIGTGSGGAIEDYASGQVLGTYNTIIRYSGELYGPSASATLPYTTTATLPDADPNLVARGDLVLRQDLAQAPSIAGKGVLLVTGAVHRVASRAEMKGYNVNAGYQFSLDEGERSGDFVVRDAASASFLIIKSVTSSSVDAASDTITSTAHGLVDGDGVKPTASVNGLTAGQLYWVVSATGNTYQLSLSYGGAAVDLTGTTNFTVDHMFDPLEGIYVLLDNGNYAERKNKNYITPGMYGAVGDEIEDDYASIIHSLASGSRVLLMKMYGTNKEIQIPDFVWCHGIADNTGFKWIGPTPATVPDKTGGTAVIRVASSAPATVPVSKVDIGDFKIDCAFTENLIGTVWIYATLQSKGNHIAVRDIGINGFGHYFSFEYYASFDSLSARGGSAGSVGFYLSTNWNQINGVPFKNCQVGNSIDTSVVLDTSDAYIYQLDFEGTLESGITAVKHIGGFGVRQGRMSVYTESYSGDVIDWTSPASPADRTGPILWENCQFFTGASFNAEEGNHSIESSGELSSITASNNARVFVEGNASATLNTLDTAVIRRNITVTARPNANKYAALDNNQLSAQASNSLLAGGTASAVFALPSDLLIPAPSYGQSVKVVINGRRTYAGVEKHWEGWLTFNSLSSWVLTKYSFSSADDATWAVSVNSSTGAITVDFNSADQKIVEIMWIPS